MFCHGRTGYKGEVQRGHDYNNETCPTIVYEETNKRKYFGDAANQFVMYHSKIREVEAYTPVGLASLRVHKT